MTSGFEYLHKISTGGLTLVLLSVVIVVGCQGLCTDIGEMEPPEELLDAGVDDAGECEPESSEEFCERLGHQCGTATGADNCGDARFADCSLGDGDGCGEFGECMEADEHGDLETNACVCDWEVDLEAGDDEICDAVGAECDSVDLGDLCTGWEEKGSIDCGDCDGDDECGLAGENICGCPCEIDGGCQAPGDASEQDACQVCDPDQSTEEYVIADDGTECGDNAVCQDGDCLCGEGYDACGDDCVDFDTDTNHCGGCDKECTYRSGIELPVCEDGECGIECIDSDDTVCESGSSEICVDTDSDDDHCGGCGNDCESRETCEAGECVCDDGYEDCGGSCVNTDSHVDHCGSCNNSCSSGEVCSGGSCDADCGAGETNCDGSCVDTDSDDENCGGCGDSCSSNEVCDGGTCEECVTEQDCGNDESCVDNECVCDEVSCGTQCGTVTNACGNSTNCGSCSGECFGCSAANSCTINQCGSDEECIDDECQCAEECCANSDCASGEECNSGTCECAEECCSDSDCPSDEECENNECVEEAECSTDSECTGCEECSGGSCVDDDSQCGSDEECDAGSCECAEECCDSTDCGPDELCEDNECVEADECTTDDDCDGDNDICDDGECVCQPDCTGMACGDDGCGGQCGDPCGNNYECEAGQCVCQEDCCKSEDCGDQFENGNDECWDCVNYTCQEQNCESGQSCVEGQCVW